VILGMLVVKRLYDFSYEATERFVSDSITMRQFCRLYLPQGKKYGPRRVALQHLHAPARRKRGAGAPTIGWTNVLVAGPLEEACQALRLKTSSAKTPVGPGSK
jgi:hypothetical protein